MAHINDHPVSSTDSGSSSSSPFVRTETYASSNSNLSDSSHYALLINVSDSFESKKFSSDSLDGETSPNKSSFDVLLSDIGVRSNCVFSSTFALSVAVGNFPFLVFLYNRLRLMPLRGKKLASLLELTDLPLAEIQATRDYGSLQVGDSVF